MARSKRGRMALSISTPTCPRPSPDATKETTSTRRGKNEGVDPEMKSAPIGGTDDLRSEPFLHQRVHKETGGAANCRAVGSMEGRHEDRPVLDADEVDEINIPALVPAGRDGKRRVESHAEQAPKKWHGHSLFSGGGGPHLEGSIRTRRDDEGPVGGHDAAVDPAGVARQDPESPSRWGVPESQGVVPTRRDYEGSVRGHGAAVNRASMSLQGPESLPGGGVPEFEGLVLACRDDE